MAFVTRTLKSAHHHLLLKELPAALLTVNPSRGHQSGLPPPVKTHTIDKALELRCLEPEPEPGQERPLVVLFGWMLAKKRHLDKYGNLYLSKGFDVLSVQLPPQQVLWPLSAQQRIQVLLDTLKDSRLASRRLLIHGFSVGGYLYGEMLVKLEQEEQRNRDIRERMVGQVFDSPVDFEGVPRGFANVLVKTEPMKTLLQNSIQQYLKVMNNSVTKHYIQSSAAFHRNSLRLPSLFLYSRADPIGVADIIESIMAQWRSQGISISHRCWEASPHVSHFHHHPDQYVESLLAFLDSLPLFAQQADKDVVLPLGEKPRPARQTAQPLSKGL